MSVQWQSAWLTAILSSVFRLCFAGSNPVEQFKSKKTTLTGGFFCFWLRGAGHSTTIYTNILKNIKFILKIAPYFLVDVIHSLAPYIPSFSKRQEQIFNIKIIQLQNLIANE